jgi:methionyl-tRNA formyltransferase
MSKALRVVMLAGRDESSHIMYHALESEFDVVQVIMEVPVSRKRLLQNRIQKLGFFTVLGQVLFMVMNKVLAKTAASRIEEIKAHEKLDESPVESGRLAEVESINDDSVISLLRESQPDVVVVNGTRIIAKKILDAVDAPFINTHAGITPAYRGVHGGYWALAENDAAHCGVTVHLVDTGIDTGGVLYQKTVIPTEKDSFNTYPLLQLAGAIPLMKQALKDVAAGSLSPRQVDLPSRLWYHPTLWQYVGNYLSKGVK